MPSESADSNQFEQYNNLMPSESADSEQFETQNIRMPSDSADSNQFEHFNYYNAKRIGGFRALQTTKTLDCQTNRRIPTTLMAPSFYYILLR